MVQTTAGPRGHACDIPWFPRTHQHFWNLNPYASTIVWLKTLSTHNANLVPQRLAETSEALQLALSTIEEIVSSIYSRHLVQAPRTASFLQILIRSLLLEDPPTPYSMVMHDEISHEMIPRGHLAAVLSLLYAGQPANCRSTAVLLILRAWLPYENLWHCSRCCVFLPHTFHSGSRRHTSTSL